MKNKTLRLALLVLLLAVVTMSVISGTLAKYVESVTGTDTARVAKFEYTLSGMTGDGDTKTLNLFDSVTDTGILGNLANDGKKLVAPGSEGSINVELTNRSEVKISAGFTLTETNTNKIPIVYKYNNAYYSSVIPANTEVTLHDGGTTATVTGDLSALAAAVGNATPVNQNATSTISLGWAWAFTGDGTAQSDASDTTLGKAGTATVELKVKCDVTQLDQ